MAEQDQKIEDLERKLRQLTEKIERDKEKKREHLRSRDQRGQDRATRTREERGPAIPEKLDIIENKGVEMPVEFEMESVPESERMVRFEIKNKKMERISHPVVHAQPELELRPKKTDEYR